MSLQRVAPLFAGLLALMTVAFALAACDDEPPSLAQVSPESTIRAPQLTREGYPDTFAYTVQAGDTLFSIAQRFSTTIDVITSLNDIEDASDIPVGSVLYIPNPPPTATPTATATQPPTGPSTLVRNGSRSSNKVALTFEMGGRVDPALDIMNYLIEHEVRATLFPTGAILENQNTDIGRQVFSLAAEHPELFDIGNHSYSHPRFTTISDSQIAQELSTTAAAVMNVTGVDPRPWFRPPEGDYNQHVLDVVGQHGYAYTVMWDVDTIDWRPEADGGPTAQDIVNKVLNNAEGGSIVLMHFGGYNTFQALPAIVQGLRQAGFELVKVAELLED